MDQMRKKLAELKARLADIQKSRDVATSREHAQLQEQESAFKHSSTQLKNDLTSSLQGLANDTAERKKALEEKWRHRASKAESAYNRMRASIKEIAAKRGSVSQKQHREAHAKIAEENDEKVEAYKTQCAIPSARLQEIKDGAQKFQEEMTATGRRYGLTISKTKSDGEKNDLPANNDAAAAEIVRQLTEIQVDFNALRRGFERRLPPIAAYFIVMLLHGGAAFYVLTYLPNSPWIFAVGAALFIAFGAVYSVYFQGRERASAMITEMARQLKMVFELIELQNERLKDQLQQGILNLEAVKIQQICAVDEKYDKEKKETSRNEISAISKLNPRKDALNAKIALGRKTSLEKLDQESEEHAANLRADIKNRLTQCNDLYLTRKAETEAERKNELERLAVEWKKVQKDFETFATQKMAECRAESPEWNVFTAPGWRLPDEFAEKVYAGNVAIDMRDLVAKADPVGRFSAAEMPSVLFPITLQYPLLGGMFVRGGSRKRDEAMRMLFGTVLRLLCSFPPAKAKLTVLDPVGLGQNFAALMHLADYDESVVGGRIWSDPSHIERKLTELTEHMEKVIQKYLRNRYATISDYNREAGQMAEPYRFLVIADFPSGFSELSMERLASILSSGVRCGVYTLILHDKKQNLPAKLEEMHIKRNGLMIVDREGEFFLDDNTLDQPRFYSDSVPDSAQVDTLVNSIGKQCLEAARVQVPFEIVAPKASEVWSSSTEQGLRLPLGKAGADRLQYMHLGKGTAQHALIAGKTGSGKSNLFHVIITNAALWFSPREVEFYLIDLKKGVEFKTYGVNKLPHARVVAIESDREYGLSVLRRIDRELSRRGELFRNARVQDFPSFRKTGAGVLLPRTILIIDEFQEFFTEDDSVAQDAALLLDRVIRQGRAFGVHVILGSQTLAGTYTIPKSTLGQVAVRIALQCNESDSCLILGDDNSAASLLSRPGEGIYNDMSGLIEGNNPFLAVYLPKDVQDQQLKKVYDRAATMGMLPAEPPAIFEGNSLADLRNNAMLSELARRELKPAGATPLWLGEANAIKGPTEVTFTRQAGSNLLVVGQRGDAGVAMCSAAMLCLAAGSSPSDVSILVLDGTNPDSGTTERLMALADALPHDIEIVEYRRVPDRVADLAAVVKNRIESATASKNDDGVKIKADMPIDADTLETEDSESEPEKSEPPRDLSRWTGKRIYLLILGLEKFRALRQGDEFNFSGGDDESASGKQFADILTEGPREGIHTIVWCDTLSNLNRCIGRKTLREFEARVLFQMSANDSSELIDSPVANKLGMYNALLYTLQNGAIEKFRPYAVPDAGLIADLSRIVSERIPPETPEEVKDEGVA